MARTPRHKHHRNKSRSQWAVAGAFVASTAFVPQAAAASDARDLVRRLESLRTAVPTETVLARGRAAQAQVGDERVLRFDIPAGKLSEVIQTIQRMSGLQILLAIERIGDVASPGVIGDYTAHGAVTRAIEGTGVMLRITAPNSVSLHVLSMTESVNVSGVVSAPKPSSPKYAQPLSEVPQTIEVIPRAVMEAQGVNTLSDALRNVPGISLQAGEGGGASNTSGDMFNLRGFSANNSLFVDGVRDDGLMSRDVFNLEQIEVFMGPTGSDVGRGTAAGYVNMQTKVPHAEAAYGVTYAYGSGDQNRTTIDLNHPLPLGPQDTWLGRSAVRVNALWEDGGVPGRDIVTRKNQSIAPSLSLGLATTTRVIAAAQITRQDNVPDYGVPGSAWTESPLAPSTVIADRPVDWRNFYGSVGYDFDKVEQESYTGRIEHDLNSSLTLRNQTRYNQTHRTAVISTAQNPASFDALAQSLTIARQGNERENEILANQTNAAARFTTGRVRHAANIGLELASERQFAPALGGLGAVRTAVSIYDPNPFDPIIGYAPGRTGASTTGKTSTIGLYAFDTIEVGARWQLSAGLRWEHYDARFTVVDVAQRVTTDLAASDALVSGKAGALYRLTDAANVYFAYGTSVTPPGTANFTLSAQPNNQNNPNVEPQQSTNYEVGGKIGLYGDRLFINAAGFRTDNKNVIFTVDASAIPPIFNQDDEQRVTGLSVGAIGQITPRWQVLANLAYLDASLITQNPANNGNRLTLTPEVSGSVWTAYDVAGKLTLGGGLRYVGDVFVNTANTIRVPAYALADAMVEYDVNAHLSLRLNIYNLTDKTYIRNVNNNGGRFNPGTPRSAMVTSSVRF